MTLGLFINGQGTYRLHPLDAVKSSRTFDWARETVELNSVCSCDLSVVECAPFRAAHM